MGAEQHLLLLRRLILHAASWVERRLCMRYFDSQEAWPLFATCDPRRVADHDAIITKLLSLRACCCKGGMAKQIREAGVTVADLTSSVWKRDF